MLYILTYIVHLVVGGGEEGFLAIYTYIYRSFSCGGGRRGSLLYILTYIIHLVVGGGRRGSLLYILTYIVHLVVGGGGGVPCYIYLHISFI